MPDATLTVVPGAGHVLHEERPDFAAEFVLALARRAGVLPRSAGAPATSEV
jgi:pimeloyl-ACP methyl ester carboxylesterase